jgi:hypothetical protein
MQGRNPVRGRARQLKFLPSVTAMRSKIKSRMRSMTRIRSRIKMK